MLDRERSAIRDLRLNWIDLIWLVFLGGLALLPPVNEYHKQLILLFIVFYQLFEGWIIGQLPQRGPAYSVIIKILAATLLLDHTGDIGINSSYYPVIFARAERGHVLRADRRPGLDRLGFPCLLIAAVSGVAGFGHHARGVQHPHHSRAFLFVAAILVNRFAVENRRQVQRLEDLSEKLEEVESPVAPRAGRDAAVPSAWLRWAALRGGLAQIRNPLGVIKGSADMLSHKVAASEPLIAELAGYISSEVNRLNALVVRFLDFARPSKLELRPERIPEIVDRALAAATAAVPDADVKKIVRQYAAALPEIPADPQLCEQVFVNLITNALQAMQAQDGSVEKMLRLSIAPEESSNGEPGNQA